MPPAAGCLPIEFEQIVRCSIGPDRRYQRATDLLKDLETVRGLTQPVAVPPPTRSACRSLCFPSPSSATRAVGARLPDGLASDLGRCSSAGHPRRIADVDRRGARQPMGDWQQLGVDQVLEGSIQPR
jgi:hypothetical protein